MFYLITLCPTFLVISLDLHHLLTFTLNKPKHFFFSTFHLFSLYHRFKIKHLNPNRFLLPFYSSLFNTIINIEEKDNNNNDDEEEYS